MPVRRYQLVIAGTVAGAAVVLAFPVHHEHTAALMAPASSSGGASSGTSEPATAPATSTPSTGSSPGPTTATTEPATAATTRTATGTDEQFQYGDIAVKVTVRGSKVTEVAVANLDEDDHRSAQIDQYAVPQLEQQALDAGSANIDGVSGATFTSQAFDASLASALKQLGLK